jgi:hypothetical protein
MKKTIFLLLSTIALAISCGRIEQIESDIDSLGNSLGSLTDRVEAIETQLLALQKAYEDGKIIKDVVYKIPSLILSIKGLLDSKFCNPFGN